MDTFRLIIDLNKKILIININKKDYGHYRCIKKGIEVF